MQKKHNSLLLIIIGGVILSACWSDDPGNGRNRNTRSTSPSTSSTVTPNSNDKSSTPDNKNSASSNNKVNNNQTNNGGFQGNLPGGFQTPSDDVGQKMLREYGAMFVAKNGVKPPGKVVFRDESDVSSFQGGLQTSSENIGGFTIELQAPAMKALKDAIAEGSQKNLSIKPTNADAAKRSYEATVTNWASRVNPGLTYWVGKGRLQQSDASRIKSLSPVEQIPEIFKLESQGMFFAKNNDKSIIYSVAPPGTSQHISMLALDVAQHDNASVRELLARHGWFQTIPSDLPHFTYLGVSEGELPGLGLKKVSSGGRSFWVPNI